MHQYSQFPETRLRRLRHHPGIRRMLRQSTLEPRQLILPLFVRSGERISNPIASMPGQSQHSVDFLVREAAEAESLGLGGIMLFGIPAEKDTTGFCSMQEDGIVQQTIRAVKQVTRDLVVFADVCLCEYTDHGHCGPTSKIAGRTDVDNDATLELIAEQAVSLAKSGADVIAPSGMMDGMVGTIRKSLDTEGFSHIPILSYAVKYASSFYGPFREAAESAPKHGTRETYQMDPCSDPGQAMREVALDLAEGADMIMVKPALAYLDIIARVKEAFPGVPLAAYNVSGEYSMVKAAADKGWLDEEKIVQEIMGSISRAGADLVLTYWAKSLAQMTA